MILICVGFGLSMKKELMAEVLKTIAVRLVVQLLLLCGVLAVMQHFGMDRYLLTAFLLCFVSTPNFNAGMVVQDEKGSQYIATTTSLYCAITIIGYILIASILF
jgi:carbon starvation protein CstA